EPVQQGNGLLDHPPVGAEPGAVCGAAAGDAGTDAFGVHPPAMAVVVVAAVGVDGLWTSSGPPASSPYRWDGVDQRDELGDVVAVAAGEADGQRDARALGDHVVFRAGPGAVDRARTGFGPPLCARTWVLSITALDQSSFWAACSSESSSSCSRCQTPAACHSASLRQQVIPEPNPSSCGRNSHGIPV